MSASQGPTATPEVASLDRGCPLEHQYYSNLIRVQSGRKRGNEAACTASYDGKQDPSGHQFDGRRSPGVPASARGTGLAASCCRPQGEGRCSLSVMRSQRNRASLGPRWLLDRYSSWATGRQPPRLPNQPALNIGTGGVDLPGWINLDETKPGDVLARVPPIPFKSGAISEILMSHVLEHMPQEEGLKLLREGLRVLRPAGRITVLVPDSRSIFLAYLLGQVSNYELNHLYVYSYCQESQHRWCYDWRSLYGLLREAGFVDVKRLNRFRSHLLSTCAWFQIALSARKPEVEDRGEQP